MDPVKQSSVIFYVTEKPTFSTRIEEVPHRTPHASLQEPQKCRRELPGDVPRLASSRGPRRRSARREASWEAWSGTPARVEHRPNGAEVSGRGCCSGFPGCSVASSGFIGCSVAGSRRSNVSIGGEDFVTDGTAPQISVSTHVACSASNRSPIGHAAT